MAAKSIKVPATLSRAAEIIRGEDGKPDLISISSDRPYKRYDYWNGEYYWEVLGHGPGDIDEERLKAGLPVCFNHDTGKQLATAGEYVNDGKKLSLKYSDFKWTKGQFTEDKKADIESGALPHTSVSYQIIGDGVCIGAKDELPIYRFRWEPFEGGPVVIPADISVGVGRQRDNKPTEPPREIQIKSFDNPNDSEQNTSTQPDMKLSKFARQHFSEADKGEGGGQGPALTQADISAAAERALEAKQKRDDAIDDFCDPDKNPAMKNEAWRKGCESVAKKHKRLKGDFNDFRQEALGCCTLASNLDNDETREIAGDGKRFVGQNLSIGQQFIRSEQVKALSGKRFPRGRGIEVDLPVVMLGARGRIGMSQRAGFTSSDLAGVNIEVNSNILQLGVQRLTIMDVIGSGTIGAAAYKYARENSFGEIDGVAVAAGAMPRAKAVGERGVKPNWDPDLTIETANVSKIAITTKVPDEFLADFPSAMSYIDQRLPFMVDTETEFEILYGDGLNDNLKGIMTTAGVQTRAVTTTDDSTVAASLRQGLTDIQVGSFFEPDFFGFHPYDWETASLLKDENNRFLAGGPFYVPYTNGMFVELRTFWGKPVVVTTAVTYGQPIAGAGKIGAAALIREGMRIEMTNSNEDDFKRNLICLRAEHRLALPVYRPVCFLEFTGFPARA